MTSAPESNPLLIEWNTPLKTPPFDQIKEEHYLPAFKSAMAENEREIAELLESHQKPDFENTMIALEYAGHRLSRVSSVFFPLTSAHTNDRIQEIAREVAPLLSDHFDRISMNEALFKRVEAVYNARAESNLSGESLRLLENSYKNFIRGGAKLKGDDKARLMEINARLSVLNLQFDENLLEENNTFRLVITDPDELSGLSETSIAAAAQAAEDAKLSNSWMFTLHKPSWIPFMQFSDVRKHRETMFNGYINRGNNNDQRDNKAILKETIALRQEKAALLGFSSWADYVLDDTMAKTPAKVDELLNQLWKPALTNAKKEAVALEKMLHKDGIKGPLQSWDWWYYTERLRKEKYDLEDAELRPWFELQAVQNGAFDVAERLFGLRFTPRTDIPLYHEDVRVVEVKNPDGSHVGLLFLDYFTRKSKSQGAWMTDFRGQEVREGIKITPLVANVFNFSKPVGDKPSLLSLEEVETLFHEFGHALHSLLSNVTYPSLAGTNVSRDFVELPSQFMENWAMAPQVMKTYALHHETAEPIPDELMNRIRAARHFNQGFETAEYLAASFLDMRWHTLRDQSEGSDVIAFENRVLAEKGLIPQIVSRYRSPYFAHIFSGGYSSGYYSYIWAAVLDSDAFAAFTEQPTLFDAATAKSFRDNILSRGNSDDPMKLYLQFRGKEPAIEPLLEKRGLR